MYESNTVGLRTFKYYYGLVGRPVHVVNIGRLGGIEDVSNDLLVMERSCATIDVVCRAGSLAVSADMDARMASHDFGNLAATGFRIFDDLVRVERFKRAWIDDMDGLRSLCVNLTRAWADDWSAGVISVNGKANALRVGADDVFSVAEKYSEMYLRSFVLAWQHFLATGKFESDNAALSPAGSPSAIVAPIQVFTGSE